MKYYMKMRFKRLRVYLIADVYKRTNYLVKNNIFHHVGKNFFFQPRVIPSDPKLISFGDNVIVASNVSFINHDVINILLNNIPDMPYFNYYNDCIEIGNNVFIGSNTTILPNVKVGNNVIIAAGSVVTKDIPDNTVVAGVPAKKISTFDSFVEKRKKYNDGSIVFDGSQKLEEEMWNRFKDNKKDAK